MQYWMQEIARGLWDIAWYWNWSAYERAIFKRLCAQGILTMKYSCGGLEVGRPGKLKRTRQARRHVW
jgi:hypothetical protein